MRILSAVYLSSCGICFAFAPTRWRQHYQHSFLRASSDSGFDGKEFEEALKSINPAVGKRMGPAGDGDISALREEQVFREYPFDGDYSQELPVLPDCNNYFSGKYRDYTWHQNADQVYVYIPVADTVSKVDVDVKFEALGVTVKVDDSLVVKFDTLERIIPDGSFWVLETGADGKKYLLLDLEKRLRMINWKNIFGEPPKEIVGESENRKKMLESLFAANKGMAKLTGKEPETIADMKANWVLMEMLNREVKENGEVVGEGGEGEEDFEVDAPEFDVQKLIKQAADRLYGPEVVETTAEDEASK